MVGTLDIPVTFSPKKKIVVIDKTNILIELKVLKTKQII